MIGIVMLETNFPRVAGDIGNAGSFSSPVIYETAGRGSVERIVRRAPLAAELRRAFVDAAKRLTRRGATVIGTSCGFLVVEQDHLQHAVDVPVMTSSLLLIPLLERMFGTRRKIGVLTFDAEVLTGGLFRRHLGTHCVVQGLDKSGALYRCIREDAKTLDVERAGVEAMTAARECLERERRVGCFLIECTNLSPYKQEIRSQFGCPVFDLIDALEWTAGAMPVPD